MSLPCLSILRNIRMTFSLHKQERPTWPWLCRLQFRQRRVEVKTAVAKCTGAVCTLAILRSALQRWSCWILSEIPLGRITGARLTFCQSYSGWREQLVDYGLQAKERLPSSTSGPSCLLHTGMEPCTLAGIVWRTAPGWWTLVQDSSSVGIWRCLDRFLYDSA